MQQGKFNFSVNDGNYTIEKDNQKISIWQTANKDVWFGTDENEVCLELNFRAKEFSERFMYGTFMELMKSIVGRYVLEDASNEFSILPKDFIDLKNRVIVWHSDNGNDTMLKLSYDDSVIKVSIVRGEKSRSRGTVVRVRAEELNYRDYNQEILDFFSDLIRMETFYEIMKDAKRNYDSGIEEQNESSTLTEAAEERKLSLRRIFKRTEKNDKK